MLHIVGILFPHINDDAQSKSHQIYNMMFLFLVCFMNSIGVRFTCQEENRLHQFLCNL